MLACACSVLLYVELDRTLLDMGFVVRFRCSLLPRLRPPLNP